MSISKDFKHVGNIDVDAGCVWLGDPCYIIHNDDPSEDLGKTWPEFVDKYFNRSGYDDAEQEWRIYCAKMSQAFMKEQGINYYNNSDEYSKKEYEHRLRYEKENPFVPTKESKGFANFKHSAEHEGLGIVVDTNYGDGSYPVYIKYGKNGRPSQVLIDFGDE